MLGGALVCFRMGTTGLLRGRPLITEEFTASFWHAKYQNVKLPLFSALLLSADLTTPSLAYQMPSWAGQRPLKAGASADPRLRPSGTPIEGVPGIAVLMPARVADEQKSDVKEDANV
jgi:hypothetical protein